MTAPISGRIGRALVTEGALVSARARPRRWRVIQQINPMYVNFTQSATRAAAPAQAGRPAAAAGDKTRQVRVVLDDGTELPTSGKLLFSDLTVDPTTGQVTLRAEVPNPDGALLPGLYVRVRLEQAQVPNAILLPQQAVTRGGARATP